MIYAVYAIQFVFTETSGDRHIRQYNLSHPGLVAGLYKLEIRFSTMSSTGFTIGIDCCFGLHKCVLREAVDWKTCCCLIYYLFSSFNIIIIFFVF